MERYTLRAVQSLLGISRGAVMGLIGAGFVNPARGRRREYLFTFQDVVLLRTAHGLQRAGISRREILRSLRQLRSRLPQDLPLTGLRITAMGNQIAVREGETHWHPGSGQLFLDFELAPAQSTASSIALRTPPPAKEPATARGPSDEEDADDRIDWFARGVELDPHDSDGAQAAYREAIARNPERVDAYLNLGVMLCEAERDEEAVELYCEALRHRPDEALLHYNLAVALEDLDRQKDALASYEHCLRLDPAFADAHYNAARLHEVLGNPRKAIRHYSEYRRLQR